MAWINPLYEEHQRRRWLRHDWQRWLTPAGLEAEKRAAEECARAVLAAEQKAFDDELWQVRRDLAALKVELAARRAARQQEAEALRRKSDLAFERFLHTFKRHAEQQKAGFNPDQARDAHGKWTDAGGGDKGPADDAGKPELITEPAFLRAPARPPLRARVVAPPPKGVETQLLFYNALSDGNTLERRAILEFNARGFQPGASAEERAVHLGVLTRDQVSDACPRYWETQSITNQAADLHSPGAYPNAQVRGTAIHKWVRDEINGLGPEPRDADFRSEVSVLKSREARYGDPESKRVDVYENPHTGTVCIYDIKTGGAGLSFARMRELATNVGTLYPGTTRIVVTEVRPTR